MKGIHRIFIFILISLFPFFLSCEKDMEEIPDSINYPEITLHQNNTELTSGGTADFNNVVFGDSKTFSFSIENVGRGILELSGSPVVEISGTDAAMFNIPVYPDSILAPFSYKNFDVVFTPSGAAATKNARFTIRNNDPGVPNYVVNLTGTATVATAPGISVSQGGTAVNNGGMIDLGIVNVGTAQDYVFQIENTGTATLTISNTDSSTNYPPRFTLPVSPPGSIAPGGTGTFTVRFVPDNESLRSFYVLIYNNDSTKNPYLIYMFARGAFVPVPDIFLKQGAAVLNSGTGTFDFGNVNQSSSSATVVFTIENRGTVNLNIGGVALLGSDSGEFTLSSGGPTVINPGGSTSFNLTFNPTSPGAKQATVTVNSDDPDTPAHTFTITGTGVAIPEIDVKNPGGASVVSGSSNYDFGSITTGTFVDENFTIENIGQGNLELTADTIVDVTGSEQFSISAQPGSSTISGGANTTFTIRYLGTSLGTHQATISIANNDFDENPFSFDVSGTTTENPAPEIDVRQGSNIILSGVGFLNPYTYFGGMNVGGPPVDMTFEVHNIGSAALNLTGAPQRVSISGPEASDFTLVADASASIAPGANSSFVIRFNASAPGSRYAQVSIANDDSNEDPFVFRMHGYGMDPEILLSQGANPMNNGDTFDFGKSPMGVPKDIVFTIGNGKPNRLYLTGTPRVSVVGSSDFTVLSQPSKSSLLGGETVEFVVRYSPSSTGTDTGALRIFNSDVDKSPFIINLTGESVDQRIEVLEVANGGTRDHGDQDVSVAGAALTYTIRNTGGSTLQLLGPPHVIVAGTDPQYFTIVQPGASTLAPGATTTFTVTFNPTGIPGIGNKTAVVSIDSDAVNLPAYQFNVTGRGISPEIDIRQGATSVISGSTYDFGNINFGSTGANVDFFIENSGTAPLILTGAPMVNITGADASSFNLTTAPTSPIAVGGSSLFRFSFTPDMTDHSLGVRSATVTIANNDLDEDPYTLTIQGTCVDNENPNVNISSPSTGAYVRGTVNIQTDASDNYQLSSVELFIGGSSVLNDTSPGGYSHTVSYSWNTNVVPEGNHSLKAVATDSSGNTGTDDDTTVIVDNTQPTVSVSSPSQNYAKSGDTVTYTVTYSDANFNQSSLAPGDITLNKTGSADGTVSVDTGNGITRTVTINGITGEGTLGINIAPGTALDFAGNGALGSAASATFVVDNTAPTVTSVAVPAPGSYITGQVLSFTVNFSENITASGSAGTLSLDIGGSTVNAAYQSGSGSSIVYGYTIQSGDVDTDGITVGSLNLNGDTIRDDAGNDANTSLNGVGDTSGVNVN